MFLGPLEGILSLRIHFRPVLRRHTEFTFSPQILPLAQYWASGRIWGENVNSVCRRKTGRKCILRLRIPSKGPKNISTCLG